MFDAAWTTQAIPSGQPVRPRQPVVELPNLSAVGSPAADRLPDGLSPGFLRLVAAPQRQPRPPGLLVGGDCLWQPADLLVGAHLHAQLSQREVDLGVGHEHECSQWSGAQPWAPAYSREEVRLQLQENGLPKNVLRVLFERETVHRRLQLLFLLQLRGTPPQGREGQGTGSPAPQTHTIRPRGGRPAQTL